MSEILQIHDPSLLEAALFEQAEPLARRIVKGRLASTASCQDQEDIVGDVLLELLSKIDGLRRGEGDPIANFAAYVAVAARHGCDRYLRRRFPSRHRLVTRLQYLLETSPDYSIWDEAGAPVCSLSASGRAPAVMDLPHNWAKQVALPAHPNEPAAVRAILSHVKGALRLADLFSAVAMLLNVRDDVLAADEARLAARTADPDSRLDHRRELARLWKEIQQLPRGQRVALLLNLRDEEGACALTAFPATGVASMREIASALEIAPEELARLWRQLPISDLEIATRLGVSRQNVINLRKAARQRLIRRTAGNIDGETSSRKGTL